MNSLTLPISQEYTSLKFQYNNIIEKIFQNYGIEGKEYTVKEWQKRARIIDGKLNQLRTEHQTLKHNHNHKAMSTPLKKLTHAKTIRATETTFL